MPKPDPDPVDPLVEARVDRAMEAWDALLPAEDAEELRRMTRDFLTFHPVASTLVERLRAREAPDGSGAMRKRAPGELEEPDEEQDAKDRAGGER